MQAGLLEEMIADTLDMGDESLDEQAEEEVEKACAKIFSWLWRVLGLNLVGIFGDHIINYGERRAGSSTAASREG